jgi:hypothetical protein
VSRTRPSPRERSWAIIVRHAMEYGIGTATLAEVTGGIREAKAARTLLPVREGRYTTTKAVMAERETIAAVRRGQGRVTPGLSVMRLARLSCSGG